MVFQNYALYPHMTVRDNMAFSLQLAKAPKAMIDQQVEPRRADPRPGRPISTAIRASSPAASASASRWAARSCATRRCSCSTSRCPTSTPSCASQMRAEIKELHQRLKTTTVYVTHDQIEAMTMADKIVVMNGGNVEQIGAPLELYDRPANLFVAGFIGSPAMNFLNGQDRAAARSMPKAARALPLPARPGGSDGRAGGLRRSPGAFPARPRRRAGQVLVVEPTGSETQVLPSSPAPRALRLPRARIGQAGRDDPHHARPVAGASVRRRHRPAPSSAALRCKAGRICDGPRYPVARVTA